ncbi:MAG: DsbA family oxidoreductase [Halioglobus sp.]
MGAKDSYALQVDIVSDVVCPWCVIGYKQLEKALSVVAGEFHAEIRWHPFELNPQITQAGEDLREHIARKYGGGPERGNATRDHLTRLGHSLGFEFDYFEGMRVVNTFRAHQLLHWAALHGKQTDLKLALFEAFFSRRQDVNDTAVLAALCEQVGLPVTEAVSVLDDERFAVEVREQEQFWRDKDVYAVPTFMLQGQYMVPGAQEAEAFVRVFRKIRDRALARGL